MELSRPALSWSLLILGRLAAAVALLATNGGADLNLDCTNDLETSMFCQFDAQNCSEHHLTLLNNEGYGKEDCVLQKLGIGQCCCSFQVMLVYGETHTATVWKGGQILEAINVSVSGSIKPKAPTIISVTESNGNIQLRWKTNTKLEYMNDDLTASVTYYKKGDTKKVTERVQLSTIDGENYYEILGRNLEPSTTYVVSVKSYLSWTNKFSDSSNEWEFKTATSSATLAVAVIISLSVFAVVITGAMYGCYVKLKTNLWDTVANPKLFISPSHHEVLKSDLPVMSSVFVEPPDDNRSLLKGSLTDVSSGGTQQSSGISTGSSCLSYANAEPPDIIAGVQDALSKVFNISPISPFPTNVLFEPNKDNSLFSGSFSSCEIPAVETSSGSSGIDNKTYSILIPSCRQQITAENSEVQTQAKMICDSAYQPSEGIAASCAEQQGPVFPLLNLPSSLLSTDMSYQQCKADSAYAEDSSLSSISSGSNTIASCDLAPMPEARCESSDEAASGATKLNERSEEATVCAANPCVPAESPSCPFVDYDYQAFQTLVGNPGVSFPEQASGGKEERLDKHPEDPFSKMSLAIPCFNNVPGGQCLTQSPLFSLVSAHQSASIIIDSGYKCV